MKNSIELEQFSGPLDLLLSLIQEQKLAISEISLAKVTEQFMAYLDTLEERRAEELADFLLIASRLLLLKSRALVSQFAPEEDEGPSLADQLRLYEQFVLAAKQVNKLWLAPERSSFRVEPARKLSGFVPPANLTLDALRAQLAQLIARLTPLQALPETRMDRAISMKQKIDYIRALLRQGKSIHFYDIINQSSNRTELIVSFLALLELVKEQFLALRQEEVFGDIVIQRV